MRQVYIEVQEKSGNWRFLHSMSTPNDVEIARRLDEAVRNQGGKRVRATEGGRVVDIRG